MSEANTDVHPAEELASLAAMVRARLEMEKSFGLDLLEVRDAAPSPAPVLEEAAPAVATDDKAARLAQLEEDARQCEECALCKTRTNLVFGTGNVDADLMFIGEAPGFEEDKKGEPFVGPAGQLLTKIIKAIDLERRDVYIANIIKCRPPQNRTPNPQEMAACRRFVLAQIEIIQPKVICLLGNVALRGLLETKDSITRARGRFRFWHNIKVMPTFHPSYLLHNYTVSERRKVWEDMKQIRDALDE